MENNRVLNSTELFDELMDSMWASISAEVQEASEATSAIRDGFEIVPAFNLIYEEMVREELNGAE